MRSLLRFALPTLAAAAVLSPVDEDEACAVTPERCARRGDALLQKASRTLPMSSVEESRPVKTAGADAVAWIQEAVAKLWPKATATMTQVLRTEVSKKIDRSLEVYSTSLKGVSFGSMDWGSATPQFGPVSVYRPSKGTAKLHLGVRYSTDSLFEMKYGSYHLVISNLSLSGNLTIRTQQTLADMPVFGGVTAYFAKPPAVTCTFSKIEGVLGAISQDLVTGFVQSRMEEAIADRLVIPSVFSHGFGSAEDGVDLPLVHSPRPIGVARTAVVGGADLAKLDNTILGSPAPSDPYAILKLSNGTLQTPSLDNADDPVWTTGNVMDFLVYDKEQQIDVHVYDNDWPLADTPIGKAKLDLGSTMEAGTATSDVINFAGAKAGSVSVSSKFYSARSGPGAYSKCIVAVKVTDVLLPGSMGNEVAVAAKLEEEAKTSPVAARGARLSAASPQLSALQPGSGDEAPEAHDMAGLEALSLLLAEWWWSAPEPTPSPTPAPASEKSSATPKPLELAESRVPVDWAMYFLANKTGLEGQSVEVSLKGKDGAQLSESLSVPLADAVADGAVGGTYWLKGAATGSGSAEAVLRIEIWGLQ
mmetsp:Transcript_43522/g.135397  ORF Transcript_43522/g.135397 Transcript_43522/m.135397 type:complete len:589 (-) Transcript_43522:84-1850(-)